MSITPQLIAKLNRASLERRVGAGIALLDSQRFDTLPSNRKGPAPVVFLLCLAQWVDLGYKSPQLLEKLLAQVTPSARAKMPLRDFLMLRMTEAFVAMAEEDDDQAIRLLGFVLEADCELNDKLTVLAHFWRGRAHRKKGEYERAYDDITAARERAEHLDLAKLAAAIRIQEAWCVFQKGDPKGAWKLLDAAERELKNTDDDLSIANIYSARGRIVRRTGEYAESLAYYQQAVDVFHKRNPDHRNLARTLVNAAYVKRLLALYLRKRVEGGSARPSGNVNARYMEICRDALADLERAGQIYALHQHHGGTGSVLVNGGYIHLDLGDIERAVSEGAKAYELACGKSDHILMARARILQAYAEIARVEEELGEDADIAVYAHQARRYAEEAVQSALETQNRRLLAGAHIVCGAVAACDFFEDWEEARRCERESRALLRPGDRDHLSEELTRLKSRIMRSIGINDALRAWSQGIVGQKTFQQISEEFAELVIPQVWLREEKKVSRVAQRLSISPKKVRRILRNTGLISYADR
jgi:tetratricopeptide (TPR) repeat protein